MLLPTPKKARLSAISLSKSLGLSEDEARHIYAQIFNFKSWDTFTKSLRPDESYIEPTTLHSIHQFMSEKLCNVLGIDMNEAIAELVDSISPFSNKKPKAYRVDISAMLDDDESVLDFRMMREMMDVMGSDDHMMAFLSEMMSNSDDPDSQRLAEELRNTSLKDFQNRMRISHPIDPLSYANIMEGFLEWDMPPFEADDICDENIHGEPCFYWLDQNEEEHPVFINSLVVSPGDSKDEAFFSVLEMIRDGYDELFEKPILLFGNPLFKTINGNKFSVIGVWNNGEGWRWLFLSKFKPWEQLSLFPSSLIDDLQNSLDNPAPPSELAEFKVDGKFPASLVYHTIAKPIVSPELNENGVGASFTIKDRMIVSGVSGWNSYV